MSMQNLLTAEESATRAGVSVETIEMFEQCGLLDSIRDLSPEGKERKLFKESDIQVVFYSRLRPAQVNSFISTASVASGPSTIAGGSSETMTVANDASEKVSNPVEAQSKNSLSPLVNQIEVSNTKIIADLETRPNPALASAASEQSEAARLESDSNGSGKGHAETLSNQTASIQTGKRSTASIIDVTNQPELDTGRKLPSSEELIEVNRGLREQLEMLRSERDWLRDRVEKLESRSEREQMLLLSESETVRRLVTNSSANRSFWARALPWFSDKARKD